MKKNKRYLFCLVVFVFSLYIIAQTYQGIGARVTKHSDGSIIILEVFPNSPAERQGLQRGNRIVSIEGVPTADLSLEENVEKLQGAAGTPVNVELAEQGRMTLTRSSVQTPDREVLRRRTRGRPLQNIRIQEGIILSLELEEITFQDSHYEVVISLIAFDPRYTFLEEGNIYIRIPAGFQLEQYYSDKYPLYVIQKENILHISNTDPFRIINSKEVLGTLILSTRFLPDTLLAEFLFEEGFFTSLEDAAGKIVLGSRHNPTDGTIDLNTSTRKYYSDINRDEHLYLSLILPETAVLNEPLMGYFHLQNPSHVSYNHVNIIIKHEGVEITFDDLDEGNHITLGINVWDGPYKADFPFTEHYRNQVDTRRHQIIYRMGSARGLQQEGILFSFQFTPKKRGDLMFSIEADSSISFNRKPFQIHYEPVRIKVR